MSAVTETILFVFGLVALGYGFGWTGVLRPQVGDALTDFAIVVAVPAMLFRTMIGIDFADAQPWALWLSYFSAVPVVWAAGHILVTRGFGRERAVGVVGGLSASFSNLLLIGIPFVTGIFGQAGIDVLSLLLAVHLPILMGASIIVFEWATRRQGESLSPFRIARDFLRNLLRNPLIIGILTGLAWRAGGLPMPSLGVRVIDAFAGMAGPIALFAMGLGLRKFGLAGHATPALALSMLKLFLMPALVLAGAYVTGVPPLVAEVLVVAAAMPTGVNPYLIASRFGVGQMLASNTMTLSTILAVLSAGLWLAVARVVFG